MRRLALVLTLSAVSAGIGWEVGPRASSVRVRSCPAEVAEAMGVSWSVEHGATSRLGEFSARVAACDGAR